MNPAWKIILGYLFFFGYMFLVIVVGEFFQKKFDLDKEKTRKIEHIATGVCWIVEYLTFGWTYHMFIAHAVALLLLFFITFSGAMESVERDDLKHSYGLIYFGIANLILIGIVVFINDTYFAYYGIAHYCLVLADGLAPIIAKLFKNHNLQLINGKSLAGTVTVFIVSALVALVFGFIFALHLSALLILSVASLAAMAELFGAKGTDNLSIALCVFGYLILAHFVLLTTGMMFVVLFLPLIIIPSIFLKAVTPWGQTFSYLFLLGFTFFGGFKLTVLVLALFAIAAVVSKLTTKKFLEKNADSHERSSRGTVQVFANSSVVFALSIAFYIRKTEWLLFAAFAVVIEGFADSMASDFGRLSKREPVDLLRFKRIPAGLSGGVSLVGTLSAFLGACLGAVIPLLFFKKLIPCLVIAGIAFAGTFVDSLLGSGLQVRYQCATCGSLTDAETHCDTPALQTKGIRWIDNNVVNLLSGILTAVAASLLFAFTDLL